MNNVILQKRTPTMNLLTMYNGVKDILYLEDEALYITDENREVVEGMKKDVEIYRSTLLEVFNNIRTMEDKKNQPHKYKDFIHYLQELLNNLDLELMNRRKN